MNIKYFDSDFFELRDDNVDEVDVSKLDIRMQNYYYRAYSLYTDLFLKFLLNNTNLKECDEKLLNSDTDIRMVPDEEQDFYQWLSAGYLKYFYLRNNLHLYRLNEEEQKFLTEKLGEDNTYDKEAEDFIRKTYKKVINSSNLGSYVYYGPIHSAVRAPADSIVLGLRVLDCYDNIDDDREWYDNYLKQREIIGKVTEDLQANVEEALCLKCDVIEFNEYSVKKKLVTDYQRRNL